MNSHRLKQHGQSLHSYVPCPLLVNYSFQFSFIMRFLSEYVNQWVPFLCLLLCSFFLLLGFCSILEFQFLLQHRIYYIVLLFHRGLSSNERQKESGSRLQGKWEGIRRFRKRGNCIKNILYEKKIPPTCFLLIIFYLIK